VATKLLSLAARAAALVGCARGEDPAGLPARVRQALRGLPLAWLTGDAKAQSRRVKSWWPGESDDARTTLRH
jgi:hypothetical protein